MRMLGHKDGNSYKLQGRSGADYTAQFPELADIAKLISRDHVIIDGEIVSLGPNGLPEFNRIQNRFNQHDPLVIQNMMKQFPAVYMVFDILEVDEFDLKAGGKAQATLMQRKEILSKVVTPNGVLKLSPWVETQGKALHAKAVETAQEGVMAKTKSGLYVPGGRNADWLKMKVPKYHNFVICGYTKGTGWREGSVGAIVLGDKRDGQLVYVGCAGSGFTAKQVEDMYYDLENIRTADNPFPAGTKVPNLETWVHPEITVRVKYYDVTKDGQLIWPIFQGIVNTTGGVA